MRDRRPFETIKKIGSDRHMGKEPCILEDVADRTPINRLVDSTRLVLPNFVTEREKTVGCPFESGKATDERRFSRARRSEQRESPSRRNVQPNVKVEIGIGNIEPRDQAGHDTWTGNLRLNT